MVKGLRLFLLGFVLVIGVLSSSGLVSSWVDCYQYGEQAGGTPDSCVVEGCVVTSETFVTVSMPECTSMSFASFGSGQYFTHLF